jgi:sugar lactone lactonase YvrE
MKLAIFLAPVLTQAQGVISTVAGNGNDATSGDGGPATSASLHPNGVTMDSAGNLYIADVASSVIRKVNTAGIISTVAGFAGERTVFSGDGGPATSASIYIASNHNGLAVDSAGNLYIADDGHNRVRKVDPSGIITTVAGNGKISFSGDGGPATSATLWRPSGVAVDHAGNLYIADLQNARIRKVDTNGIISTVAGNGSLFSSGDGGPAINAGLAYPMGVAVDGAGNIYIADQNAYVIRKVNTAGIISTVAGNGVFGFSGDGGPAANAETSGPYNVAVDSAGDLYIADHGNHRIRKVDATGTITTIAGGGGSTVNNGDGGPPTSANVDPADVAVDGAGNYYIAPEFLDSSRLRVRCTFP